MSDYKTGKDIEGKLTTDFAKSALKKMDDLGARWVVIEDAPDKIYVSPTIEIGGDGFLSGTGEGWGSNYDDIITAQYNALADKASQPGKKVVVNAYQDDRKEYTYDRKSDSFTRL